MVPRGPQATKVLCYRAMTQLTMAEWCSGDWTQLVLISFPGKMTNLCSRWLPVFSYISRQHYWVFQPSSLSNINLRVWCLYFPQLINHPVFLIHASELQLEAPKQRASCDNSEGASRRGKLHIERLLTGPEVHTHSVRSLKTLPVISLNWSKCLGNSAHTTLAFVISA